MDIDQIKTPRLQLAYLRKNKYREVKARIIKGQRGHLFVEARYKGIEMKYGAEANYKFFAKTHAGILHELRAVGHSRYHAFSKSQLFLTNIGLTKLDKWRKGLEPWVQKGFVGEPDGDDILLLGENHAITQVLKFYDKHPSFFDALLYSRFYDHFFRIDVAPKWSKRQFEIYVGFLKCWASLFQGPFVGSSRGFFSHGGGRKVVLTQENKKQRKLLRIKLHQAAKELKRVDDQFCAEEIGQRYGISPAHLREFYSLNQKGKISPSKWARMKSAKILIEKLPTN